MKCLILILSVTCAFAGTTGRIAGLVTDPDGELIAGATVLIVGTSYGSMTDMNGEYLIHNLPSGEYSLEVRMVGFGTQIAEGTIVITDMTTRIDFQLSSEAAGTTVINVSDQRGMIVFDETSTVHVISREEIETMPVATLQDLTQLQAGALYAGGGIHMRGGRAGEIVYLVDGIPMMDPSSSLFTFNIPMSAISEITVMSGGFTAEYGNAQSGVVNIITRTGGDTYTGNINAHYGDYSIVGTEQTNLTNYTQWEDQMFRGDALGGEFAVGGPEPLTTYLLPALGLDIPGNISLFSTIDLANYGHDRLDSRSNWDNNWEDGISGTLKLTYIPSPGTRFMASGYYENSDMGWRDWRWSRINEADIDDGDTLHYAKDENLALPTRISESHSISFSLTQTLSDMIFAEIKYNHYQTDEKYRIVSENGGWIGDGFTEEDWLSYEYVNPAVDPDDFYRSSTHAWLRHDSRSIVRTGRIDLTALLGNYHQLKTGWEGRFFEITQSDRYITGGGVLSTGTEADAILHGIYLQDRIEYTAGLIVNAGLRLDYINPQTEGTDAKYNISPRLGISHPITERDIIRMSYGHYYQVPNLSLMFWGTDVNTGGDPLYGNPNLEPEETVSYEIGLKHQFDSFTLVGVTGFYKNISGLVSVEYQEETGTFWQFINDEGVGTVRGTEVTFMRLPHEWLGFNFNYTYSIAKGPRSSVLEEVEYGTSDPVPHDDVYLDWDQRHMVNASFNFSVPFGEGPKIADYHFLEGAGLQLSWSYGSGIPYDNASHGTHPWFRNQKRYPARMNTNLTVDRGFDFAGIGLDFYCSVYNLFNRRNIERIYNVAWYDADMDGDGEPDHNPTGSMNNMAAWSPARHFLFGLKISW